MGICSLQPMRVDSETYPLAHMKDLLQDIKRDFGMSFESDEDIKERLKAPRNDTAKHMRSVNNKHINQCLVQEYVSNQRYNPLVTA